MKTHLSESKEETGRAPACTGALLRIKRIQRVYIKEGPSDWSKEFAGCAQYLVNFVIKAPKGAAGLMVSDRIRVGSPDDKEATKKATWEVSEGGPARLRRLLTRAGVALVADDEEWMADAVDRTVVAPITVRNDFTNVGLYYRETDKDCPVIGLADEKGKAKRRVVEEADDAEDAAEEAEEEEKPEPKKGKGKKAPAPETSDDDDDEDDD